MNNNNNRHKHIVFMVLVFILVTLFFGCTVSSSMIRVSKNFDRVHNKTLIIKPYVPARERDRVSVSLLMREFNKGDEDSFYSAVISSVKSSNLFRRVIVADTVEEAESTKGNVYMRISNNVASFWVDEKGRLNARFNTTISLGVKNRVYFYKVYDETGKQGLFGPNLKVLLLKRIIRELLVDLSEVEFPSRN